MQADVLWEIHFFWVCVSPSSVLVFTGLLNTDFIKTL